MWGFSNPDGDNRKVGEGLKKIQEDRENVAQNIRVHKLRQDLELLYDALLVEYDRVKALQNLTRDRSDLILKGWVPAIESKSFKQNLVEEIGDIYIELRIRLPMRIFRGLR